MAKYTFLGQIFKDMFEGKLVHIPSDAEERILDNIYDAAGLVRLRDTYCVTSVYTLHTSKFSDHIQYFKDIDRIPAGLTVYTPSQIEELLRKHLNENFDHYDILCIAASLTGNTNKTHKLKTTTPSTRYDDKSWNNPVNHPASCSCSHCDSTCGYSHKKGYAVYLPREDDSLFG